MAERTTRPTTFLTPDEKARVEDAIAAAERSTSGEIRVVIARSVRGEVLDAARARFARLKMHETRDRSGVLILLAVASRRFAIFGDREVDRLIGQQGWDRVRDGMAERFAAGAFADGLIYAVAQVSEVLSEHFPWREDDVNELSDEVVEE